MTKKHEKHVFLTLAIHGRIWETASGMSKGTKSRIYVFYGQNTCFYVFLRVKSGTIQNTPNFRSMT